jgi:polar amino acid transport system permease protein
MSEIGLSRTPIAAAPPPPAQARGWTGARVAGMALLALWTALGVGIVALLWFGHDQEMVDRYLPRVILGVWVTIELVGLSLVFGAILSVPLAATRFRGGVLGALSTGYCAFFRGTPLLAQTFLVYYGVGQFSGFFREIGLWWFFRDAFYCAILAFSLNTAAYQAEILAGAIRAVPRGQWQAAEALGLGRLRTLRHIIVPQALITALRPYGNEVILMIKGSAVASVITVFDLMGETGYAYSKTYSMQVYIWAAILYLIMVEILRRLWDTMEHRLTRHLRRSAE